MACTQCECEDPVVLVLDLFHDVGLKPQVAIIADEPRIGVGRDVADVPRPRDQGNDVAAILARSIDDDGILRNPLRKRRQLLVLYQVGEERRLLEILSPGRQ